jgi:antitoxin VapB
MVMACSAAGRAERRNVSLNIKNAETYQLVQELVALTGETQTAAVTIAVRERLDRLRHLREADLTDRLLAIGAYTAPPRTGCRPRSSSTPAGSRSPAAALTYSCKLRSCRSNP